jgi:hypothetical protein
MSVNYGAFSLFCSFSRRLGVYGEDFRITGWKLQGVRWGRCHPTCPTNPFGVVFPDTRISRQDGAVPAQRAAGQRSHPGGGAVSLSGEKAQKLTSKVSLVTLSLPISRATPTKTTNWPAFSSTPTAPWRTLWTNAWASKTMHRSTHPTIN